MHHQAEIPRAAGGLQRLLVGHPVVLDRLQERLVEGLHPVILALGDGGLDLADLSGLRDEVPNAPGGDHALASVVDLPLPVVPVTRIMPRYSRARVPMTSGNPRS